MTDRQTDRQLYDCRHWNATEARRHVETYGNHPITDLAVELALGQPGATVLDVDRGHGAVLRRSLAGRSGITVAGALMNVRRASPTEASRANRIISGVDTGSK